MKIIFFLLFTLIVVAKEFTVGSYNVKNLFDTKFDGTEYDEFIPKAKGWNKAKYTKKLKNIAKVIKQSNIDIIGLQEIESKKAMRDLKKLLPRYRYYKFVKTPRASIGIGLISRYPIVDFQKIDIKKGVLYRAILKAVVKVDGRALTLFINHWPSKRSPESNRIKYAKALSLAVKREKNDYIILGDLNSNYNESSTLKHDKKLNNTRGKTGINTILQSNNNTQYGHFNPWFELDNYDRYSFKFRGSKQTPDHILLPPYLFDNKNISYIKNSFSTFKYKGDSDHYMIYAKFTTNAIKIEPQIVKKYQSGISKLYQLQNLSTPIVLKDVVVLYRYKNSAIIKDKNRAVFLYRCAKNLKVGYRYNMQVNKIKDYFSLKEVTKISNIRVKSKEIEYKKLFLDAKKVDIFKTKYQNEIVTNLVGVYKRGDLHLTNNKKIKIYSRNRSLLPKNGSKIEIVRGHLASYKDTPQIFLHTKKDYRQSF
ncbi:MAG TPA: endonuclease [Campylobacterales bacterium]|nr:endonuclease [Campylobacterales bacterium]